MTDAVVEKPVFHAEREPLSPKAVIGYHTFGMVDSDFAISLAKMYGWNNRMISRIHPEKSPYVTEARNLIVQTFIETGEEYLLMIDADLEFPPESFQKTWAVHAMTGADVIYGNYALGDYRNSLFAPPSPDSQEEGCELPSNLFDGDLQSNLILEATYTGGTGWLFMTRQAALKIAENYPDDPWKWFNHDFGRYATTDEAGPKNRRLKAEDPRLIRMGEDISFGIRAHNAGLKVVGYTGLLLLHAKTKKAAPAFMEGFFKAHGITGGVTYGMALPVPAKEQEDVDEDQEGSDSGDEPAAEGQTGGIVDREGNAPDGIEV